MLLLRRFLRELLRGDYSGSNCYGYCELIYDSVMNKHASASETHYPDNTHPIPITVPGIHTLHLLST